MPELPEVETVKNALKEKLIGTKIINCQINYEKIIEIPEVNKFQNLIKNKNIKDIKRYGKILIFDLEDYYLLSHLRMEGKYFFKEKNEEINKHEHVIFNLDNNKQLRYHDTRKFGKMYLIKKENIYKEGPLSKLGLEPFDEKLTVAYLKEKFKNKTLPIKTTLLDQQIITGLGNIYSDEILFQSKINPIKKTNKLNDKELEKIIDSSKEILKKAIEKGGTTIHSYKSVDGISGKFQLELKVHGKKGEQCLVCKEKITKIKVGGRGTYYCQNCQK